VQVFVIMYALSKIVGLLPALAGVAAMVLVAPLNMLLGSLVHKYRLVLISKTDARVKIMTEVINGALTLSTCTQNMHASCCAAACELHSVSALVVVGVGGVVARDLHSC
jgi:hypothetical protein